jgi:tetratricopeptide (TPR) repeat protein
MVTRPVAILLLAGLGSASALAQEAGKAMLNTPRQPGSSTQPPGSSAQPPPVPINSETRGDIFMVRKEYREAIETYAQGASKNAVLDNKMGIAYHQLMDLDRARKCYEQALKLKPDYFEAINNLGTVYYAKKNYRRAIVWYNRALKVDPDSPRAASTYMNRGTAWFARKQYDKALEDYQTAVHIEPDIFEHHGTFGQILEERNVEERAKYHFFLAKLYARQGRNELALQNLRKALEEGFKGKKKLEEEPDFATLKDLPDFKTLLASEPRAL